MKIKSLKQILHWLFLSVGIISLLLLIFSVVTYTNYAREGYGLDISVTEAWLSEDRIVFRLQVDNPGGLELYLDSGNLTLAGNSYPIEFEPIRIKADNVTMVIISTVIGQPDLDRLAENGMTDISMNLTIIVPDRYATTGINISANDVEVRP
ncbi:MAG: hypothetical protein KKH41_08350 [Candidatus Thermoplasmatota archaeon]|nr:hypothetical protein [Euryarchaeota archaeon]MBU4032093.1 hypothetical protein [Candidatus Thermoplasmatota archaeon]MBU4071616.1 hypothetical protein [Candidatus Thermoplasmatota archaeon]MBU4145148.1 hypothetical protein [Candidatus Thermoplasmatota archaeon]MBU4592575.1 hypothetical protein [Candidatus Thermoplasmatota archaeon]